MRAVHRLVAAFHRLQTRERVLIFGASHALLLAVGVLLFVQGPVTRAKQTRAQTAQLQQQIQTLQTERVSLENQLASLQANSEFSQLQAQLQQFDQELQRYQTAMVRPAEMAALLSALLPADGKLKLITLEKLLASTDEKASAPNSPAPTAAAAEAARPATAVVLTRHRLRLELRGDFNALHAYLQALEGAPWKIYWDHLDYQVERWPNAHIRLELSTLGEPHEWLGG